MKLPSFRIQILIIIALLLIITAFLTHAFFISNFREYEKDMNSFELYNRVHDFYLKYEDVLDKEEMRGLLQNINQSELTTYLFERRMTQISIYYLIISSLIFFLIFLFLLNALTRPLIHLRKATKKVRKGDLSVRVKEIRLSPINHLIVSFNDMIQELESNRDQLIQAEKDLMWREMAQVVAHEIKNPLTPLQLSVERMEMKYGNYDKGDFDLVFDDALEVIYEEIENLRNLVQEFSKFARMPSSNLETYNIKSQVEEILNPYKDSVKISLQADSDLPKFYGDKLQIKQVFVNLIQNAIDALREKDEIFINLGYKNENFVFSVKDTGKGLSKKEKLKIFRPYYTTKQKGTGLGLAIVKRIVKQHGGSIEVISKVDQGTEFTIIIHQESDVE